MKIVTFHRKNGNSPKRVVDFPLERDTFRNKIMEIVHDFDEKSYNNNGKPWKSSRILRVNFFIFLSFFLFFHFFIYFIFTFFHCFIFSFSDMFFHVLSCSFMFFHFLSFSFIFFHFLAFSYIFFHVLSCSFTFFHFLSFSFIFFNFLSFSFMFFHFLSFSFILFHFLSFSFIFFHFLSFSFIFFHVLSFSFISFYFPSFSFIFFVFVGCSKSVFFGPQFRYDFSWQFFCEKPIFGPISGGTPLGPLFLFFLLFFSTVFFFFCFFSHFLFISSFFGFFNVFHFIFSFWQKKMFLLFFFSCTSFKYFLLLSLVSEFNCFLRSRCSMEMWCPDDLGRDSWDLGWAACLGESMLQLPRVRWRLVACENGASPDCIIVVVVFCTVCARSSWRRRGGARRCRRRLHGSAPTSMPASVSPPPSMRPGAGPPLFWPGRGRRRRGRRESYRRLLFLVVDVRVPCSDKFQQSKVRSDPVHPRLVDVPVVQQRQVPTVFFTVLVQFLGKVVVPVLCNDRCVVRWCSKLWLSRSCSPSKVVDTPFVPQRQIPMVQSGRKTTEAPQLQFVARWSVPLLCRSCSMPVVVFDRCPWFRLCRLPWRCRSCSSCHGCGRPCHHAATSCLATVEVHQIQFIAGVSGHYSSQQRRALFQWGMAAMRGFWAFFDTIFRAPPGCLELSASFWSPRWRRVLRRRGFGVVGTPGVRLPGVLPPEVDAFAVRSFRQRHVRYKRVRTTPTHPHPHPTQTEPTQPHPTPPPPSPPPLPSSPPPPHTHTTTTTTTLAFLHKHALSPRTRRPFSCLNPGGWPRWWWLRVSEPTTPLVGQTRAAVGRNGPGWEAPPLR